jgi:release factor glutamine methyltransferase
MQKRPWRLLDILNETSRFFSSRGLDNARLQAELLLADVLALRRLDLYLQFERVLTPAEVDAYREHVKKRLQRIPVQYITGRAAFRNLELRVSSKVLIPRPETEMVVEVALEQLAGRTEPLILDLGCGSGAIALAIAHELTAARLVAADVSPKALEITCENAERCGVGERLTTLCGDLFAPLRAGGESIRFDAIVSNPPYVRRDDIAGLEPEVRECEPRLALDGGVDGLEFYRRIAAEAGAFLRAEGCLVLEVGDGQADPVIALLTGEGHFAAAVAHPDLNGVPRVVVAR